MAHKSRFTMDITEDELKTLRELVTSLGFVIDQGRWAGWGSPRQFIKRLIVVYNQNPEETIEALAGIGVGDKEGRRGTT